MRRWPALDRDFTLTAFSHLATEPAGKIAAPKMKRSTTKYLSEPTITRVPGDCVFFHGLLKPSERLQHRADTEDPNVHPSPIGLEQVRMEACESVRTC